MRSQLKPHAQGNIVIILHCTCRVLIADPGNTGYGGKEELLLGTKDAPGAHLVISRELAFNRGR